VLIRKTLLFIAGLFLIALGIVGLILPVMPGWIFIFLGLSFIAPEFAEKLKQWVLRK